MRRALLALLLVCGCSAPPSSPAARPPAPAPAPLPLVADLEKLIQLSDQDVVRKASPGHPGWRSRLALFPTSDPAFVPSADRKMAMGRDGRMLIGASDGSLLWFDPDGKPRLQLGVRGPVSAIEAQVDGGFVVHTDRRLTTFVGPDGSVQEKVGLDPPLSSKATAAYRARRVFDAQGKPFRDVVSMVALGPTDVWALVRPFTDLEKGPQPAHLLHGDGRTWTDRGVPTVTLARQVFAEGHPAAVGTFEAAFLARGPKGRLQVIGSRIDRARRVCVLEMTATGLRERRDLSPALAQLKTVRENRGDMSYAASSDGREVVCVVDLDHCVEASPAHPPRVSTRVEARRLSGAGAGGAYFKAPPLLFAGNTLWNEVGWANGEADLFALHGDQLVHHDGTSLRRPSHPLGFLLGAWGSGPDDLWLVGANAVARFDGARWHRIFEVEVPRDLRPAIGELSVTGSGPGDVWVFGAEGMWHITPSADREPDLSGAPPAAPRAVAASVPLAVGPADPTYRLEKVELELPGREKLRHALRITASPDGVVWLHDGVRLVEHDDTRSRVLHQEPKAERLRCVPFPVPDCMLCAECRPAVGTPQICQRCAAPTGAARGAIISRDTLLGIDGAGAPSELLVLPGLHAVSSSPSGSHWAVSASPEDDLPRAVIVGPRGLRFVSGLPAAAYADVAVRADDDVWFAGGLTSGRTGDEDSLVLPAGEGSLVRFDGRAFTRHRGPDGALLSVSPTGPGEAWAVGVAGGLLHAKGGVARAFHLRREGGERPRPILRAVASSGPSDVWIVGDGSTLLRWDGTALRGVDTTEIGEDAALSGVVAPGARPGWVVGPRGIWRILRAPAAGN